MIPFFNFLGSDFKRSLGSFLYSSTFGDGFLGVGLGGLGGLPEGGLPEGGLPEGGFGVGGFGGLGNDGSTKSFMFCNS